MRNYKNTQEEKTKEALHAVSDSNKESSRSKGLMLGQLTTIGFLSLCAIHLLGFIILC